MPGNESSQDTTAVVRRRVDEEVARERAKFQSDAEIRVQQATIETLVKGQEQLGSEVRTMIAHHTEVLVKLERGEGKFNLLEQQNRTTSAQLETVASRVKTLEDASRHAAPISLRTHPHVQRQDPSGTVVIRGSRNLVKIIAAITALVGAASGIYALWGGASHTVPDHQETKK